MNIRAVIFDVGTVLVHEEPVEQLLDRWHERSGIERERLAEALSAMDPEATAIGRITEQDVIDGLVEQFELTDEQVEVWMADLWDWYCGSPNEMVCEYARALRPTHATAILTNSMDGARREEARRFGFDEQFDALVYSHEIGCAKPDPKTFAHVLELLGREPQETAFVDDRLENVESAADLGLRAVHYLDSVSTLATLDRLLDRS